MLISALAMVSMNLEPISTPTQISTIDGKNISLIGNPATALIFVTTTCPIARAMQPTLIKIHKDFSPKGVQFISIQIDPTLEVSEVKSYTNDYKITWPQSIDKDHRLVAGFKAKVTPEAVLLNKKGEVVYQGRIDNTYPEIGVKKDPTSHELRDAIEATLQGRKPKVAKTKAIGCIIPSLSDF